MSIHERVRIVKKSLVLVLVLGIASCLILTAAAFQYQGPETELIALINGEREAIGVPTLVVNWEVARLARNKSEEMTKHRLFGHESLVYGDPAQTLERFQVPYSAVGANIAMGQETAQEVLDAWLSSPGHRANLVNSEFSSAGVGLSWDENGIPYWTLILVDS